MKPLDYTAESYVGKQLHTAQTHGSGRIVEDADVVIVGTGPGGLTSGVVLAEAGAKVVYVEAGQFWPQGSFERKQSWALSHLYQQNGSRVMLGNCYIPVASGKGVGGGTLVNSGICFRAPDYVLDLWTERFGHRHWGERDAMFSEVEEAIGVVKTPRSIAGKNSDIARRGFSAMGVDHGYMPRNAPGCTGCGTCQTGCPSGGKASSDLNWLPRSLRAGATLYADTRVDEIVMDGERAVGVRGAMRDPDSGDLVAEVEVRAERVVLACGAIHTPALLQRNELADSSGMVGKNLHVQPGCGATAEFEDDVRIWSGAAQGYYAHHPDTPEVLAETFTAPMEAFYTQIGGPGEAAHDFMRRYRKMAGCGVVLRDRSSGRIVTGDDGPPRLFYNMVPHDIGNFRRGVEFVSEMYFEAGARRVRPMYSDAKWFTTWNECRQYLKSRHDPADFLLYASHPMGTCRMGDDPKSNVTRPEDGRTHDHEGLYVLDASLLPTALGANPQMTIMANSLALARNIAAEG